MGRHTSPRMPRPPKAMTADPLCKARAWHHNGVRCPVCKGVG